MYAQLKFGYEGIFRWIFCSFFVDNFFHFKEALDAVYVFIADWPDDNNFISYILINFSFEENSGIRNIIKKDLYSL
ncbi:MAG: hypothetical protein ACJARZ_000431 [Dokdonia sp.]|jgi:hypothetical protein